MRKRSSHHTPGPWFAKHHHGSYRTVYGPDKRSIVSSGNARARTSEEAEANILLAAAAPELLEALEACVTELWCNESANEPGQLMDRKLKRAIKLGEAALEKAKGNR